MTDQEQTYTLPCGITAPLWAQALHQLALRCIDDVGRWPEEDARRAALINELHVELISYPRGRAEHASR